MYLNIERQISLGHPVDATGKVHFPIPSIHNATLIINWVNCSGFNNSPHCLWLRYHFNHEQITQPSWIGIDHT